MPDINLYKILGNRTVCTEIVLWKEFSIQLSSFVFIS
jgi:hypothetical protein